MSGDRSALRLGFVRGTAPGKWAKRWADASPGEPLELVALDEAGAVIDAKQNGGDDPDVRLERVGPGERPEGADGPGASRHAIRLYAEAVGLVVPVDHELAEHSRADHGDLALVRLLAHPFHEAAWPNPQPWEDPSWAPSTGAELMELVASGTGCALLPLPLARQLAGRKRHAVLPVEGEPGLPGTWIWATWSIERDDADVQLLAGILRGRTARSSRGEPHTDRPDRGGSPGLAVGGKRGARESNAAKRDRGPDRGHRTGRSRGKR